MSFKRTKVVMLPTNEKAKGGDLRLQNGILFKVSYASDSESAQHLYFLSDEEIKEGDWWIDLLDNRIFQVTAEYAIVSKTDGLPHNGFKKIIATTDRLEISDEVFHNTFKQYLPEPSEGFILKFADSYNTGKPITEVNAEYEIDIMKASDPKFDLEPFEKLKVDPKDNTITIKKLKDTWTRDEVVTLILQSNLDSHVAREGEFDIMHWIAENL